MSPVYSTPFYIKPRRVLVDEKCWELAEHFLSDNPRVKNLNPTEYRMHVQGLAEEFQFAAENYSLPEE